VTSIGDARSCTSPAEGAFSCNTTPPAGSLGAVVKPQYCWLAAGVAAQLGQRLGRMPSPA